MDDITATFTLRLTPEDLYLLLSRTLGRGEPVPPGIVAAIVEATPPPANGNETPASVSIPAGDGDYANTPRPEIIPEERIAAVETVIAAALPPKPTRSRARTNGTSGVNTLAGQEAMQGVNSTPLAPNTPPPPEPEPLDEPAMRALLSKVGAVHPLKVKAITDLLEAHGGRRRLSECDPSTWPAIATAANATLVEYSI